MFNLKLLINFLSLSIAGQIDWRALGKFTGSTGPALKPSKSPALLHQADPFGLLHIDIFVPTSTKESTSEEDEKVLTTAIHKSSPTPRLFNDMFDDDYCSPHICLMAKGEKVKSKSKAKSPPRPSDISSSDIVIALVMTNLVIKK